MAKTKHVNLISYSARLNRPVATIWRRSTRTASQDSFHSYTLTVASTSRLISAINRARLPRHGAYIQPTAWGWYAF